MAQPYDGLADRASPEPGEAKQILHPFRLLAYPWWSLAIFFLCISIVHGIFIYGDHERAARA